MIGPFLYECLCKNTSFSVSEKNVKQNTAVVEKLKQLFNNNNFVFHGFTHEIHDFDNWKVLESPLTIDKKYDTLVYNVSYSFNCDLYEFFICFGCTSITHIIVNNSLYLINFNLFKLKEHTSDDLSQLLYGVSVNYEQTNDFLNRIMLRIRENNIKDISHYKNLHIKTIDKLNEAFTDSIRSMEMKKTLLIKEFIQKQHEKYDRTVKEMNDVHTNLKNLFNTIENYHSSFYWDQHELINNLNIKHKLSDTFDQISPSEILIFNSNDETLSTMTSTKGTYVTHDEYDEYVCNEIEQNDYLMFKKKTVNEQKLEISKSLPIPSNKSSLLGRKFHEVVDNIKLEYSSSSLEKISLSFEAISSLMDKLDF